MKLLEIIIPIYNEEKILQKQTRRLKNHFNYLVGKKNWSFLFINNGSHDNSQNIIDKLIKNNQGRVLFEKEPNYGKAIRKGILNSKANYAFLIDIDQWDLPYFKWCWKYKDSYDYFVGSRRSDPTINTSPKIRKILSWGLNMLINLLFDYMGTDTHGPKFINILRVKKIAKVVQSTRGQFDTELVLRLIRNKYRIVEIPISHKEIRKNKFPLFKKTLWNIFALLKMYLILRKIKWSNEVNFNQFSRKDVLKLKK